MSVLKGHWWGVVQSQRLTDGGREPAKGSPTQQDGVRGGPRRRSCQFSVWGSLHRIKSLFPVEPLLSQAEWTRLKRTSASNASMTLQLCGNMSESPYHPPQGLSSTFCSEQSSLPGPESHGGGPQLCHQVYHLWSRGLARDPSQQSLWPGASPCALQERRSGARADGNGDDNNDNKLAWSTHSAPEPVTNGPPAFSLFTL